ncbi:MAG: hypothetical protein ACJ8H8_11080, partial [Geminicoccaceae bacterium]
MSYQVINGVQSPFGEAPIPSLAEVMVKLGQRPDLSPRQLADLRSAVRCVARTIDLPLEGTPARLDVLRHRLDKVLPAAHGLGRPRWNTLRSQFATALRLVGFELMPGRFLSKLDETWAQLHDLLSPRRLRDCLSRFCHYCSVQGIAPEEVDDQVFARFRTAMLEHSLLNRPEQIVQRTMVSWNQAAALVPAWPRFTFDLPNRRNWYALPLAAFPASFAAEVQAWLDRLGGLDPLQELPFRPLAPSSLRSRRYELRQLASALVHKGRDPAGITSLRDLVEPAAARQALTFVLQRTGGEPSSHLTSLSGLLLSVARHWVGVDAGHEAKLKQLARR